MLEVVIILFFYETIEGVIIFFHQGLVIRHFQILKFLSFKNECANWRIMETERKKLGQ